MEFVDAKREPIIPTVLGDRDCLRALVRLAGLLTGNPHEAEDLAAEAVARTLTAECRSVLNNRNAYPTRIVVNLVKGRRRRTDVEQRYKYLDWGRRTDGDAAEQIVVADALSAALYQLPLGQRTALVLRLYADLSEVDTAAAMGVPFGTVKSLCSRGLHELRSRSEGAPPT